MMRSRDRLLAAAVLGWASLVAGCSVGNGGGKPAELVQRPIPNPLYEGPWRIHLTPDEASRRIGANLMNDVLSFKDGMFMSRDSRRDDFTPIPYETTQATGGFWFTAVATSDSRGTSLWHGWSDGHTITGENSRINSAGQPIRFHFEGTRE